MKTIAVIFGGKSAEHDISIITALSSIIKPLELTKKYNVEAVYIDKKGQWFWDNKLKDIGLYSSGAIDKFLQSANPISLSLNQGFYLLRNNNLLIKKRQKVDIVFPSMHGTNGEDGSLMGLLELANIPYVGCDLTASVIAMDKILAKQVASYNNINTAKFLSFNSWDLTNQIEQITESITKILKYPLFIKPASLGSSIGITKVKTHQELKNAIELAAHFDAKIIIEEAVNNLVEVTLPVIGNQNPEVAYLEEPITKAEDFFDFNTKYLNGGKKGKNGQSSKVANGAQGYSSLPANLDKVLYTKAEDTALSVYKAFGCQGIARIDLLIDQKTKKVYFNEVNPMPGGLYAHNWQAKGLSNVDLVEKLLNYAEESFQAKKRIQTTFETNYLRQF